MNVKRFTARTSRDALVLVRQALGEDAVVLSTKPSVDGVEVLAMAPEGMKQIERMAAATPAAPAKPAARAAVQAEPAPTEVTDDVAQLSMSTLSFQDYVRDRMLRRRSAALAPEAAAPVREEPRAAARPAPSTERHSVLEQRMSAPAPAPLLREPPVLSDPMPVFADHAVNAAASQAAQVARRDQEDMMSELRSMKGLIEERFGALAFMEKLNRQPAQARLTQKLLDCGFSPALIRKIGDSLPMDVTDEATWAAGVLERNLLTAEAESPLEDQGGVYALVGATGVGKTTTTAKIAAAFAAKYGANNLGLITLDAYRIGAHEQLRAYGRILGVPVHTAHDRASLEDLLELLAGKKMVLIDTAGMAQRDTRTRELLDMLSHREIRKLLVINAASQGETIEDVLISYHAPVCAGIVLSKMDEAVKLGPALDAMIRMKLKVIGVANGQRVPEDWHRLSANALVHRALRAGGSSAYKLDASDVSLIFTAPLGQNQNQHRGAARPLLNA
ncbi:flagellar biosynthesis protein FlhF [Rhizobacter sp. Root404]|uniref:flagellar biosynthesis protein FlhF n=1 Tax=Rhizobacter sp. Root404 TaxID=1736528 RepID=UPI0006F4D17B|nr:flagellar biosynthesis protein FlhF [Rhizobacter sp. Root404]KQW40442.1 flagellar biosynthesis protein FlhF [Rhizobacter sp. Root404]